MSSVLPVVMVVRLSSFEGEYAVVAAETRAVRDRIAHVRPSRLAHEVDLESGVELVDVDRRVKKLVPQRADHGDGLGRARAAKQVPDHRFGGRYGYLTQCVAENLLHRKVFCDIALRCRGRVGVDVPD